MNANERAILEMIVQRLQSGRSCKSLVMLLHNQTMQALPHALRLNKVTSENRDEVITACQNLLKNGELSK